MKKVAIIDYGSGNLRSAAKAFENVCAEDFKGAEVYITNKPEDLKRATHIVLPGVGAFGDCILGLKKIPGMIAAMETQILKNKKPFLGICVGMQLLADTGYENGKHQGLGWIKGEVKKISPAGKTLPVPHMGWNNLLISKDISLAVGLNGEVYFTHSYNFIAADNDNLVATADYGGNVTAIIAKDNVMGVQFHPEKSQRVGLKLIRNFVEME